MKNAIKAPTRGENHPDSPTPHVPKNRVFTLKPGFKFNPFSKWPRNYPCYCGSNLKFKKCCESKIYHAVSMKVYEQAKVEFELALNKMKKEKGDK